ncbi:MAG TPA: four helix bundle suffix domain-containing protein [Prolixibacteraceae bacterium]|nr:four helix bundle suffix domain-containing protein [Prolixibacteraceae bacterium]
MPLVRTRPPETISNMSIFLIRQTDFMLFKQLESLAQDFLKNGGIRERMTRMRIEQKKVKQKTLP